MENAKTKDGSNIDEALRKACEEPSLAKALASMAIWESERVVRFVREHPGEPWDTCFRHCFERLLERYPQETTCSFCNGTGRCQACVSGHGSHTHPARIRDASSAPRAETTLHAAISYIERDDGRILCVWNRRYGCWTMPGGLVEVGESIQQAQARELREETGLGTASAREIYDAPASRVHLQVDGRGSHVHVFLVSAMGEPREVEPSGPVTWLTRDEFLKWCAFGDFYREFFARFPPRIVENSRS